MRIKKIYIHEQDDWPNFFWNNQEIVLRLGEARNLQGKLMGKMETMGFDLQNKAILNTLTLDIVKSSEIEGEHIESEQVRSSIATKLGMDIGGTIDVARDVDGLVEMMLDATQNYKAPLSADRLFDWHAALFPTGRSGIHKITVANWRKDDGGPMQVVSGALGKEKIHYEAPKSEQISKEMKQFIHWFENENQLDPVLKTAIAHFWFVTVHPFDDGNGRITRAITDMLLARSDNSKQRFYSMSAQIRVERKGYYSILEKTQR